MSVVTGYTFRLYDSKGEVRYVAVLAAPLSQALKDTERVLEALCVTNGPIRLDPVIEGSNNENHSS